jgi:glucokinase
LILIADLGATNARFCVTEDCNSYSCVESYSIKDFDNLENLCRTYISDQNLLDIKKAVIGVAAPILGDSISFVNVDLTFSIKKLKDSLFTEGLIVVNDLALQANALFNLDTKDLSYIGDNELATGPKILVSPGTGLGLAGVVGNKVVSTEAGHINISDKVLRPDLKKIIQRFISENSRVPTYEDFLSGKGISFFYSTLSGDRDINLTNEQILSNREDNYCLQTIGLLNYLLSSYLRYMTLVWGAHGGVLLSGSIINSLIKEEDYEVFRTIFEDSETMKNYMEATPLAILRVDNIGFAGGLELAKIMNK